MRVFVTGATGFIGIPLVQDLMSAGHEVIGLARSDAAARRLQDLGVRPHRGSIRHPETLHVGATESDGVIHLAYTFSPGDLPLGRVFGAVLGGLPWRTVPRMMKAITATNDAALDALGAALQGTGRPLVTAFATMGVAGAPGERAAHDADEGSRPDPKSPGYVRSISEEVVKKWAGRGVRASIVRLAPSVHGPGDGGLIPQLADAARKYGEVIYVDDGANHWSGVHVDDAAALFGLALGKGIAGGVYHGVGDPGLTFRQIADIISRRLDLPLRSVTQQEAQRRLGFVAPFVSVDNPVGSERTRRQLDWTPNGPTLAEDLDGKHYFQQ